MSQSVRQADRQADTDRQADRKAGKQEGRQADRSVDIFRYIRVVVVSEDLGRMFDHSITA